MPNFALTRRTMLAGTAALAAPRLGHAQANPVRIGVLADENSYSADASGPGSILAAQMAAADFGPSVLGSPIEILHTDTQNKADTASAAARTWFDQGVDAVVDMPATPVAAAAAQVGQDKNKLVM